MLAGPMLRHTKRFRIGSCDQLIGVGVGLGDGEGVGAWPVVATCALEATVAIASAHTNAHITANAETTRDFWFIRGVSLFWFENQLLEELRLDYSADGGTSTKKRLEASPA
jgi:hypothetical protein